MDGRGVPLSIIVTAANVNDGKRIDEVLVRPLPSQRERTPIARSKHLCADAGLPKRRGAAHHRLARLHPSRRRSPPRSSGQAAPPWKRARRWVVEVCHSWFNRFRKLLVRYEKLERSFLALNHLAAAIIAFRKVPLAVNIIYG